MRNSLARPTLSVLLALLLFTTGGCGLLSGSQGEPDDSGNEKVEKSSITVGVLPITDMAPFYYAKNHGYFQQEGIENVSTKTVSGGAAAVSSLVNGEMDFTFGNWVSFFTAQDKGMLDLRLVADGYQAAPGVFQLMTMPGNGINSIEDLRGKKIAVNTLASFNEMIVRSALKSHGMSKEDVEFVELDFPDMPAALQRDDVQAISPSEPFNSKANLLGASTLTDLATGPTEEIPFSGYGANNDFVQENPKTVAAFQRVIQRASKELSQDESKSRAELPKYAKMDPSTAQLVALGKYPLRLDPTRLKRVKSLMQVYNLLPRDSGLDIEKMIVDPPQE